MSRWGIATSILFLVPCMVLAALWLRSHRKVDWVSIGDLHVGDRGLCIWSADGSFALSLTRPSSNPAWTFHHSKDFDGSQLVDRVRRSTYARFELFGVWGFSVSKVPDKYNGGPTSIRETLLMPYWMACAVLAALAAAPPARAALRRRRRRRRGLCLSCGYDLRGTSSGPCPECGASRPSLAAQ